MKRFFDNLVRGLGGERALALMSRSSDIFLAILIISILMMLIFPIQPGMIDVLISINLTASIVLIFVSIYIQKATQLSIFPSLLLITTLYRLGVNIASTRQILLHAYAGHIINAFGNFVVGGNYVVGIVVFLIIVIVQFIVVTKGSERVAEVAARFTLDAMPGKQMSIDADLRSGIIDTQQARELRLGLNKESQLYGAMDGAMKFVKGDAIASIVIAFINIIGGLIIGVTMHNMDLGTAAKTYTLLSIGDGLVSQIPSIIIAITAGMVTTRVSSDRKDSNLGQEIADQIFRQPKALMIAGIVLFLMAWIPGFPAIPFVVLAALIGGIGYFFWNQTRRAAAQALAGGGVAETAVDGHSIVRGERDDYALTLPIVLELGEGLSQILRKDKQGLTFIDQMIPRMRQSLYQELGVRFPGVHVRVDSLALPFDEYAIHLHEVPITRGRIIPKHLLTNETEETLRRYNLPFLTEKSAEGMPALWVEERYREVLERAGIRFWTGPEVMILHLSRFFRKFASEFIGIQEVRAILEFVERSFPDLTKEVTRLVPLQRLTEILRRLVQEQISIKDLRTILEALSEWGQTEKDTVILTEYVRLALRRYISYKYSLGQTTLAIYVLDPEIEEMIRGAIKQTSAGSYLALDPDASQLIIQAFRNTIKPFPTVGQPPVLVTNMEVRRFVRKFIEEDYPDLPVISFQEIVPEIRTQPLGRVQLS